MFKKKISIVVLGLCLCIGGTFAREKTKRVALGVNAGFINDKTQSLKPDGLNGTYETRRERISLEALYGIAPRLKMKTALGLSAYISDLDMAPAGSKSYSRLRINKTSVLLSQKLYYDLFVWQNGKNFLLSLSPFAGLSYEHMSKWSGNQMGFDNLESPEASEWIDASRCAMSGKAEVPRGIVTFSAGLSAELKYRRVGLFYDLGYAYSTNHTGIDARLKYADNVTRNLRVDSRDRGLAHSMGIRYYF